MTGPRPGGWEAVKSGVILTEQLLAGLGLCIKSVEDADAPTGTTLQLRKDGHAGTCHHMAHQDAVLGISRV